MFDPKLTKKKKKKKTGFDLDLAIAEGGVSVAPSTDTKDDSKENKENIEVCIFLIFIKSKFIA